MFDTKPRVLSEFKNYADFSGRVDRYFNVINIYGTHHNSINQIYQALPTRKKIEAVINSDTDDDVKRFLGVSASSLGYMETTNIFNNTDDQSGGAISEDSHNFAFYTCYCFQWSLFEDFTKTMIRKAIDGNALSLDVVNDLRAKWRRTKQFFDKIHSGDVFGTSPFIAILPVMGWQPSTEEVGYDELDAIRELRNSFIHGVESPEIISEHISMKQNRYNRSMWILRKFAENIQWDMQRIMD
jgi:hypothetical protein